MKHTILFLAIALSVLACQGDGAPGEAAAAVEAEGTEVAPTTAKTAPAPTKTEVPHVEASVLAPLIGLWHYQTVAGIKDPKVKDDYLGRWIDLKGDQTFTSGIWQEQTNSGKWTYDGESTLINFYYDQSEVIYDEFQVQGAGMDIVAFLGNTSRTKRGIQIKMVKENERPVR
ncbi:MAG: hypothetical protein AAFW73_20410 [Bacteroidota bacterium]